MPIPDYQTLMLPLLKHAAKHDQLAMKDAVEIISDEFGLSEEERNKLLDSGIQRVINNRIGWARTYLSKAGLLSYPKRGYISITERGKELLNSNPNRVDNNTLIKYPEFIEFRTKSSAGDVVTSVENSKLQDDERTPEEDLHKSSQTLKQALMDEILAKVKAASPTFFEELVVDTLVKMGYGGSRKEAGQAIGKSGDEGIDGIINEDRLGLDVIYIQAKRWDSNVGRPEIQKFAGALQGKRAKKGVFITTSDFTAEAKDFARNIEAKIILISGTHFAELMWDYEVGIATESVIHLKKIDLEYFGE